MIFFLDSDEALTPDSVANALEILEKDPECGCVHGVISPEPLFDDGPVERYRVLHAHWWRVRGAGVVETAFFAQAAVRREVFERIGGFDESLRDSEDLELSDRLAPHYRIVLTDRVVAHHDEVERLGPLLAETYRRALVLVPALASARRGGRRNLTANSPASVATAAFTLAALPLAAGGRCCRPPGWPPSAPPTRGCCGSRPGGTGRRSRRTRRACTSWSSARC